jgi:hypothetical protein
MFSAAWSPYRGRYVRDTSPPAELPQAAEPAPVPRPPSTELLRGTCGGGWAGKRSCVNATGGPRHCRMGGQNAAPRPPGPPRAPRFLSCTAALPPYYGPTTVAWPPAALAGSPGPRETCGGGLGVSERGEGYYVLFAQG